MNRRTLRRHLLSALAVASSGCSYYEYMDKRVVPVLGRALPRDPVADPKVCQDLLLSATGQVQPVEGELLWCQAVEAARPVQVLRCETTHGRREVALQNEDVATLGALEPANCRPFCGDPSFSSSFQVTSCELGPELPASRPHLLVAWKRTGESKWNPFSGVNLVRTWQGRRPTGWVDGPLGESPGQRFAAAAALEAASVEAFRELEAALLDLGAPFVLLAGCRHAAADEARHARDVGALAERWGAEFKPGEGQAPASRRQVPSGGPGQRAPTLEDLCVQNLVEGCMGEAFAAALAEHQAHAAKDPAVRRVARTLAVEEAGHAALGFRVHAWLLRRLSRAERHAVALRFEAELDDLARSAAEPVPLPLEALGFLGGEHAGRLQAALRASLWQPALDELRAA